MPAQRSFLRADEEYKLLPEAESPDYDAERTVAPTSVGATEASSTTLRLLKIGLASQTLVILALLAVVYRSIHPQPEKCVWDSQVLYSPAQDVIEYEPTNFHTAFEKITIYREEPGERVDQAWSELYNAFGILQLPKDEADKLPNKTLPIPNSDGHYVASLAVFHQLHCLNTIRKALRPEHYVDPVTGALGPIPKDNIINHVGHCVDSIRQGLMCAGDISPIVWDWSDEQKQAIPNMDVAHSCRNYDRIVDWAKQNQLTYTWDKTIKPTE